jgi:hypothetical protein
VIDAKRLLADLQKQVRVLEDDLRRRAESDPGPLGTRYKAAVAGRRTGVTLETWREQQLTQVAVGWVLACVFTRFCEDNGLLPEAMLAGRGDRLAEARERQMHYFRQRPSDSDLEYVRAAVRRLEEYDATRALVDRHNPMHLVNPSPDMATGLLDFWRRIDPSSGELVHDFHDDGLSTRFLGDLYQNLSEQARKDYALLQTPGFVEEFILDRTLDPAIDEFGLAEVRLIDPACGSGHFLLGAFARLLRRWQGVEPGIDVRVHVERVLGQVHGVDINPYAAEIARFRLIIAALKNCKITRLKDAPTWKVRVAIGDSLRFGVRHGQHSLAGITEEALVGSAGKAEFVYEYEDAAELEEILGQRYRAVVANPPYITVKDSVINAIYRELWDACHRQYHLSAPFTERLFDLAAPDGFVGLITDSAFMAREYGKKLIEEVLARTDLNLVIDAGGANIPGHGTPTVILVGRNRRPVASTVRAVLGVSGGHSAPDVPGQGLVWSSIVQNVETPGAETGFVSVVDLDRARLARHPWVLSGGGAIDLVETVEANAVQRLGDVIAETGSGAVTREDNAYMLGDDALRRHGVLEAQRLPMVEGDTVRDWSIWAPVVALWPYNSTTLDAEASSPTSRLLWPYRRLLSDRVAFGATQLQRGLSWFEYSMFFRDRFRQRLSIAWWEVATHNHFVLDRGGKVFKQTAPLIKLDEDASEEDYLRLLGILNSSTACFWLRRNCHNKGEGGGARVEAGYAARGSEAWKDNYAFNGTTVSRLPIAAGAPLELATQLDALGQELQNVTPAATCAELVPTRDALDKACAEWERIRAEMIWRQEELDWEVYRLYDLLGDDADALTGKDLMKPLLQLGERAFEIALARKMAIGEIETQWFARHGSTPITEMPAHWPEDYRALVEWRLQKIADDPYLHLIERPECKRRWATKSWEDLEAEALRGWLRDRLEARDLWYRPSPTMRTVAQLADELRADADFGSVAQLYARDADLIDVIRALTKDQHVPFLVAWRYTDSGMRVRKQWEDTWELQRREDAGEKVGPIPVPPKYKQGDFRDAAYWRNRGKLDVPKERFISYPNASRDGTLLLGWAGWDHLQQAQALATYVAERRDLDAWGRGELTPLLAGLAELLPWVAQWHPDVDPEYGVRPTDAYTAFLDEQLLQLGLTRDDLTAWRPPAPTRGRRRRTT